MKGDLTTCCIYPGVDKSACETILVQATTSGELESGRVRKAIKVQLRVPFVANSGGVRVRQIWNLI